LPGTSGGDEGLHGPDHEPGLVFRGQILDVEINHDSTTYSLRDGERLVICHEDDDPALTRAKPAVSRLTLDPPKAAG